MGWRWDHFRGCGELEGEVELRLTARERLRVVRGDINFKIQRDPSDFLFLIDPYGPYLIEFSFENGSFLLTKALFWVNFCPFRATGRKGRG